MLLYLTTLVLVRFWIEDLPSKKDDEQDKDFLIALGSWKPSDHVCQMYVINCVTILCTMSIMQRSR